MNLKQYIKEFISKNSLPKIITNAEDVIVEVINKKENCVEFSSYGSRIKPYKIVIQFDNEKIKKVQCNCPYDYGGLCKHSIASLKYIAENVVGTDLNKTILQLENHNLDEELLQNFFEEKGYYQYAFTNFEPTKIESVLYGWNHTKQNFSYNSDTKELTTECTCSTNNKLCEHKAIILKQIIKSFGVNYFNPDYKSNIAQKLLEKYNLPPDYDYKNLFEIEITKNGVKIIEKNKNLICENTFIESNQQKEQYTFKRVALHY